jgi:hypothetical protein
MTPHQPSYMSPHKISHMGLHKLTHMSPLHQPKPSPLHQPKRSPQQLIFPNLIFSNPQHSLKHLENSQTPALVPTPHLMITCSKNFITKPKLPIDGTVRYPLPKALLAVAHGSLFELEPTCYTMASKSREWRQAMNLEFDALLQNHTWTLVPSHPSQNLIGCK